MIGLSVIADRNQPVIADPIRGVGDTSDRGVSQRFLPPAADMCRTASVPVTALSALDAINLNGLRFADAPTPSPSRSGTVRATVVDARRCVP